MSTHDKDFKVKNGLVVEGNSATVNGNQVLTTASSIDSLQDVNLAGVQNTNVLSYLNGVWIPVSDVGLQGIQGVQGLSGAQGVQGIQGIYGESGIEVQSTPPINTDILWLDTSIEYVSSLIQREHDWVAGSNTAYEGIAAAGVAKSSTGWKVTKIVVNSDGTTIVTEAYPIIWDNRYTETYS